MTIQNQIDDMKAKLSEAINQRSQLGARIHTLKTTIDKLETIAESAGNPNLADDLVKPFEVSE